MVFGQRPSIHFLPPRFPVLLGLEVLPGELLQGRHTAPTQVFFLRQLLANLVGLVVTPLCWFNKVLHLDFIDGATWHHVRHEHREGDLGQLGGV